MPLTHRLGGVRSLALLGLAALFASCGVATTRAEPTAERPSFAAASPLVVPSPTSPAPPPQAAGPTRAGLLAAPLAITIGGLGFRAEGYVWRDFMPSTDPPKGVYAVATLTATGPVSMPQDIDVDRVWVLSGSDTWEPASLEKFPGGSPGRANPQALEVAMRSGPFWEPGALATVVMQVRGAGTVQLLRAPEVRVDRTS